VGGGCTLLVQTEVLGSSVITWRIAGLGARLCFGVATGVAPPLTGCGDPHSLHVGLTPVDDGALLVTMRSSTPGFYHFI